MKFTVIDTKTGEYPDLWEIALQEEWAKSLCYCDMEGFAVEEDGTLILMDECGRHEYPPDGRFKIAPLVETNADRIRSMTDIQLAKWVCSVHGTCPEFCPMASDCDGENCDGAWLDWLRQESEGER